MTDSQNSNESKFGFKDKEKALDTLKLLESEDMQYRKLTVRGLLGRAKRVLTMTKAEDKLKNINEAIQVFEGWLQQNGGDASNQNIATNNEDKVETVPGLGFKDKEAAMATLKVLEGRDPEYQKLAIKGLIGSSKRVLSGTKNEEKIKSIQEGVKILEDFLEKFEVENMMRLNRAYLPYAVIEKFPPSTDEIAKEFLQAYGGPKAKGNYKHLRTMFPSSDDATTSWDIIRNKNIEKIMEQIKKDDVKLFDEENNEPTDLHMQLIHWAYSPQPEKVKAFAEKFIKKSAEKRRSHNGGASDGSSVDDSSSVGPVDGESPPKKKKSEV